MTRIQTLFGKLLLKAVLCTSLMAQNDASWELLANRINAADPTVVAEIRSHIAKGLGKPAGRRPNYLLEISVRAAGDFRDAETLPFLHDFYQTEPIGEPFCNRVAFAIAKIAHISSRQILKRITWSEFHPLEIRLEAAAALLQLAEPSGPQFLLLNYDLFRLKENTFYIGTRELGQSNREVRTSISTSVDAAPETMARLITQKFEKPLRERMITETRLMSHDIQTLLSRLALNRLPEAQLQKLAQETQWSVGKDTRFAAIEQLSLYGGTETIPFLETLLPWTSDDTPMPQVQNKILKEYIEKAVLTLRYRHWQFFLKHPEASSTESP